MASSSLSFGMSCRRNQKPIFKTCQSSFSLCLLPSRIMLSQRCLQAARTGRMLSTTRAVASMEDVVIVSAARTPIGSFNGVLSSMKAPDLGAVAIKEVVARAGLAPEDIGEVYMGNVVSALVGQAPAKQAALFAGLPNTVPCTTINKVCASGMKSVMMGAQSIMLGHQDIIVAGGFESMSNIPYAVARGSTGFGHTQMTDLMIAVRQERGGAGRALARRLVYVCCALGLCIVPVRLCLVTPLSPLDLSCVGVRTACAMARTTYDLRRVAWWLWGWMCVCVLSTVLNVRRRLHRGLSSSSASSSGLPLKSCATPRVFARPTSPLSPLTDHHTPLHQHYRSPCTSPSSPSNTILHPSLYRNTPYTSPPTGRSVGPLRQPAHGQLR